MDFKDLLAKHQIDPQTVLILRHVPPRNLRSRREREKFLDLLEKRPDAFNAYQQSQPRINERTKMAIYVASFIGHTPGSAVFVGLYRRHGQTKRTAHEINSDPAVQLLISRGLPYEAQTRLWFDLRLMENFHPDWKEKLIIKWPAREINWHRFADSDDFKITDIPPGDSVTRSV
jgi:hypothetical protein